MENNKIGSSYHEVETIYSIWHADWGEILAKAEAFERYFNQMSLEERKKCIIKRGEVTWESHERAVPLSGKLGE